MERVASADTLIGIVHGRLSRDGTAGLLSQQPGLRIVRAYSNAAEVLSEPIVTDHILLYDLATGRTGPSSSWRCTGGCRRRRS